MSRAAFCKYLLSNYETPEGWSENLGAPTIQQLAIAQSAPDLSRACDSSGHILRPVQTGLFFQEDSDQRNIRRRYPADPSGLTQG